MVQLSLKCLTEIVTIITVSNKILLNLLYYLYLDKLHNYNSMLFSIGEQIIIPNII